MTVKHLVRSALHAVAAFGLLAATPALAQQDPASPPQQEAEPMPDTPDGDTDAPDSAAIDAAIDLLAIITLLDEEAELSANGAVFHIEDVQVQLVFDVRADRMRLIAPIVPAASLEESDLHRLMQANFDSALDARYAIAQDRLWATFIHPLTSLTQDDYVSGIAQTVSLVTTYGTAYSSGTFVFNGGDSQGELEKELSRQLAEKAKDI